MSTRLGILVFPAQMESRGRRALAAAVVVETRAKTSSLLTSMGQEEEEEGLVGVLARVESMGSLVVQALPCLVSGRNSLS